MWIKLDCEIDNHPKAIKAGFWGVSVAMALWRVCKRHNKPGILDSKYFNSLYLAKMLGAEGYEDEIEGGIKDAIGAGFFEIIDGGKYEVVGWKDFQGNGASCWDKPKDKPIDKKNIDKPHFNNPRTQKLYDLITKYWPSYTVQNASESAVKLSTHFADSDIDSVINAAHARWEPSRGLYEKNGLHGYLFAFFQNHKNEAFKPRSNYKPQQEHVSEYRPKAHEKRVAESMSRTPQKAPYEKVAAMLEKATFLNKKPEEEETNAEAIAMLGSIGVTKPE